MQWRIGQHRRPYEMVYVKLRTGAWMRAWQRERREVTVVCIESFNRVGVVTASSR